MRMPTPILTPMVVAITAVASTPAAQADPRRPIAAANAAARVQPQLDTFQGAVQRFAWRDGGLYQIYAAPGRVTDIVLEEGESLIGSGPIAAGDTVRWIIGDTESGLGERRRVHVLVKPAQSGLITNLIINTDRRTYYVELRATPATYMASVAWTYPKSALIALAKPSTSPPAPVAPPPQSAPPPVDLAALSFDYRISGDKVDWRPQQVFDDGRKTVLVFSSSIAAGELPPLFVLDAAGRPALVNYRIEGRRMITDRLLDRAELRLGDKRKARRVRIERIGARER